MAGTGGSMQAYYATWQAAEEEQLQADVDTSDARAAARRDAWQAAETCLAAVSRQCDARSSALLVKAMAPKLSRRERMALKAAGQAVPKSAPQPVESDAALARLMSAKESLSEILTHSKAVCAAREANCSAEETCRAVHAAFKRLVQSASPAAQDALKAHIDAESTHTAIKRPTHDHDHDHDHDHGSHAGSCAAHAAPDPKLDASAVEPVLLAARGLHTVALTHLAVLQLRARRLPAVMDTCRDVLLQDPTCSHAWILRGKAFAAAAALLLAELHFDRALQLEGVKPDTVEAPTPHLEDIDTAISSFDLAAIRGGSVRDALGGTTAAGGDGAELQAAKAVAGALHRLQAPSFWPFVSHLLHKCNTARACKRWLLTALDATCHWSREEFVRFHCRAWESLTVPAPSDGGPAALPDFMAPPAVALKPDLDEPGMQRLWDALDMCRELGRRLFKEGFHFSAAAAFEAAATGAATVLASSEQDSPKAATAHFHIARSLLNLSACLMKRRMQLAAAAAACEAATQHLAACTAALEAGHACPATLDEVFRLRMKCMFRQGTCLVDVGQYGPGLECLTSAWGELQDACASQSGAQAAGGESLQPLLLSVRRAVLRGKYIAGHAKRIVAS